MKSDPPTRRIVSHPRSAPALHRQLADDPAWIEERRRQRREKWNAFWRDASKIAAEICEGLYAVGKVVLIAYAALLVLAALLDHRDRDC